MADDSIWWLLMIFIRDIDELFMNDKWQIRWSNDDVMIAFCY